MTDFDKKLIEKADKISRWRYRDLDILIGLADTDEAREKIYQIQRELIDLCEESR